MDIGELRRLLAEAAETLADDYPPVVRVVYEVAPALLDVAEAAKALFPGHLCSDVAALAVKLKRLEEA